MAKFKVGDKVRAKDPAWPGYQGHALGHDVYVVKKVDWDGTVKLDGFIDVWVSPGSLISANAACNAKWVILYRDGGKEKIDAPTHDAAKKVADERSRKSGRGYISVIVDDGVDYGVNAVRSRNAVTDKSWDGKQLSVGDWVRQKDSGLFGRIVGKYNNYLWNVKWRNGNDTFVEGAAPDDLVFMRHDTSSINSVCSRNAVVQKALNAVAQNYDVKPGWTIRWNGELKPGTKITVVDTPVRYGGMTGEVVRRERSYYVVRLDDIAGMEVRLNPNQISVKNAVARNDKWIDDFHVIVTAGKPDPALLEALKKKAAAWKAAKRNFSDKAAADAHDKATDDAMAIAKRLGARWIQQGAVTRVVMPNASRSTNAVVAKAMNAAREVTATNVRWRIITKMWSGPLFPYGDETYATKAEAEKRAEELRRADSRSMRSYFVEEVDNSKALNAVAVNGYATIRRASGGTAQVREGDEVIYKGEKCRVLRLDDPVGHALIEDDGGREYTPRYSELKAV